jgi:hypothetical protein
MKRSRQAGEDDSGNERPIAAIGAKSSRSWSSLLNPGAVLEAAGAATLALSSPAALADTPEEIASVQNENLSLTVNGRLHALDLDLSFPNIIQDSNLPFRGI